MCYIIAVQLWYEERLSLFQIKFNDRLEGMARYASQLNLNLNLYITAFPLLAHYG